MIKNDKTYDLLKYLAQIVLPGVGALYFSLAGIWGLPEPDKVVGTITVIDVFLGLLLKRSSDVYNASDEKFDGSIVVDDAEVVSVELKDETGVLDNKDEIVLKVDTETTSVVLEEVEPVVKAPKPRKRSPRKKL